MTGLGRGLYGNRSVEKAGFLLRDRRNVAKASKVRRSENRAVNCTGPANLKTYHEHFKGA
jgi:hypothetical protein